MGIRIGIFVADSVKILEGFNKGMKGGFIAGGKVMRMIWLNRTYLDQEDSMQVVDSDYTDDALENLMRAAQQKPRKWLTNHAVLTSCAGMTCHARREPFVPKLQVFSQFQTL
ncbi:hypothetical protein E2986_10736 [Frieseomelitta varia]|uniref:Uncharacterized protein n=1 Tax=Frieseomelitta varia TaxID=561572 RepID=A0A833S4M3_9HYME|nr:hypothetical protein E2986_10736 [Frieseomelitta varia]